MGQYLQLYCKNRVIEYNCKYKWIYYQIQLQMQFNWKMYLYVMTIAMYLNPTLVGIPIRLLYRAGRYTYI